jgi:hypothetical protein
MGQDEVFIPFAVAAITPLGCAWVASRFVSPTNKWIYSGVIVGTAYLSWKYIVPRMLTSMGYPVPFEAESFGAKEDLSYGRISTKVCITCDPDLPIGHEMRGDGEIGQCSCCGYGIHIDDKGCTLTIENKPFCHSCGDTIEGDNCHFCARNWKTPTEVWDGGKVKMDDTDAESFGADTVLNQESFDKLMSQLDIMTMNELYVIRHQAQLRLKEMGMVFNAESKFIRPYDGKHGIKLERDNKGRYRRKLSVPLKKR